MKPDKLIADKPDGCEFDLSWRLWMEYLADSLFDAELEADASLGIVEGSYLLEPTKTATFLRQLLAAARRRRPPNVPCGNCLHRHESMQECGHYFGEMKWCHCTAKVTA